MDLKVYYQKIREARAQIGGPFVVVASLETPDGGRAGVLSQVPREVAARLLVDGLARLGTPEEEQLHQEQQRQAARKAEEDTARGKLQVAFISEADYSALKDLSRP